MFWQEKLLNKNHKLTEEHSDLIQKILKTHKMRNFKAMH